jgi:ATP-dependent RNA/DNA helicase IGHMBP2
MNNSQEELANVLALLETEMQEDRLLYKSKMEALTLASKKEEGLIWYPISITDTYYGMGDRLIVELEKNYENDSPNHFQGGKVVKLFSANDDDEKQEISGVVSMVRQKVMKIVFFVDELPDWAYKGKLGVEIQFDETSYKEMLSALKEVHNAKNNRIAKLREVLLGFAKPQFDSEIKDVASKNLNESQNKALNNILKAYDVAIIHGPPGTGKTTTMVEAINEVLKNEEQILVCAASNAAVDYLTEKIAQKGLEVVRIGNPARISEEQLKFTLDVQVSNHKEYKRIKGLRKQANELRNLALKYKRNFGREEREQRKLILREARKIAEEAGQIENYIVDDLLTGAQVITSTLVGSSNHNLKGKYFQTVFIDEAAQALEPATWIAILKAERVIFAGDHKQLPPTIKSFEAAKKGLSVTLFEKCIQRQHVDVMLTKQYRMHEQIMRFSSSQFYNDKLEADETVKNHLLGDSDISELFKAVSFIDTAGCGYHEKTEAKTLSTFNPEEADLLSGYLEKFIDQIKLSQHDSAKISIGVISPYKAQVEYLKNVLPKQSYFSDEGFSFSINTIDGFQGQERDVILISLVRSNETGEIGFLSDTRRMNVALTRARKKLVIVGDSSTLGNHIFYKQFLTYIEGIDAYHSAFEYINW